ncbi:hypothetical protein PQX77_001573 [Marasmius sp. AFHP31]|nr:hypothetical protein PQX77_001573 [Marasmius sp. AFHP31]
MNQNYTNYCQETLTSNDGSRMNTMPVANSWFENHSQGLSTPSGMNTFGKINTAGPSYQDLATQNIVLSNALIAEKEKVSLLERLLNKSLDAQSSAPASAPTGVNIPSTPGQLDPTQYEDLDDLFWTHREWEAEIEKARMLGSAPYKWGFLVDDCGAVANDERVGEMTEYLFRLCAQLKINNQAPPSASKIGDDGFKYLSRSMRKKYIEFGLCEKEWKLKRFLKEKYPDFKTRHLKEGSERKRKSTSSSKPASVSSSKKSRTNTPVSDVIGCASSALPSTLPISTASSSDSLDVSVPSSIISASVPVDSPPTIPSSEVSAVEATRKSPQLPSSPHDLSTLPSGSSRASSPLILGAISTDVHADNVTAQAPTQACSTQDVVPAAAPNGRPKRRQGNPLAGLSIPKTVASTPVAPPAESTDEYIKYTKPTKGRSAKNLYLIDYLKTQNKERMPQVEFDSIWTSTSKEVKQKYKEMGEKMKGGPAAK